MDIAACTTLEFCPLVCCFLDFSPQLAINVFTIQALQDGFLIVACDGVWDILSNQEAVDFVHEGISNGLSDKEIVESVFKRCISEDPKMTSGLGGDNMTFLLVRFLDMQSS